MAETLELVLFIRRSMCQCSSVEAAAEAIAKAKANPEKSIPLLSKLRDTELEQLFWRTLARTRYEVRGDQSTLEVYQIYPVAFSSSLQWMIQRAYEGQLRHDNGCQMDPTGEYFLEID